MNRDDLAAFVQRVTRQAVPAHVTEEELFSFLEFRYRWLEDAWYRAVRRLALLGHAIGPAGADEVSRSTTARREGHSTTTA